MCNNFYSLGQFITKPQVRCLGRQTSQPLEALVLVLKVVSSCELPTSGLTFSKIDVPTSYSTYTLSSK